MKLISFLLLIFSTISYGQKRSLVNGNTYALIVGISSYADEDIPDLRYAHKDAEEFKNYLLSDAAGNVPSEQIKYLVNDDATISNVYTAMKWLEDIVQKDDLVYFYFSGHGDIEKGLYKLGFLIAHDTPNLNYINNAIRIEDVNIMANNLSVTKDANVVMITDACHSGKLSGSDNARSLSLGDLLSKVENNEIRIASCEPNQLSKEDAAWGGGRGVFSYYLINGLKGLADQDGNNNKEVTIKELQDYLSENVKRDVKRIKRATQIPVIKAKSEEMTMSYVNDEILSALDGASTDDSQASMDGNRSIGGVVSAQEAYFKELSKYDLKSAIDFRDWNLLSEDQIIDQALDKFNFDYLSEVQIETWIADVRLNVQKRNSYKQQFASAIHNEIQRTINAYLLGDKEEMEKRKYYNVNKSDFDEYVFMLEVAMKLISPNDYLYHMLEVKKHYFAGIAARLKVGISENIDSLITIGMAEQEMALKLDDKAAYIHNEIGLLFRLKRNNEAAIIKFEKAIEIAPNWAIPVSNLGNAYLSMGNYDKGFEMAKTAVEMQPTYVNAKISLGRNAIQLNNYLLAEDVLLKAAKLNEYSYESREELGNVYASTIRYGEANFYYQEADNIRKGLGVTNIPDLIDTDADGVPDWKDYPITTDATTSVTFMDSTGLDDDPIAHFVYAMNCYRNKDYNTALRFFKKTLVLSHDDPLAYYYIGNIHLKRKDCIAAEVYYDMAMERYLTYEEVDEYLNTANSFNQDDEVKQSYLGSSYSLDGIYFNLSCIYREMNYKIQAEDMYWKLIDSYKSKSKEPLLFYRLLWEMKIEDGLYAEAESLFNDYRTFNPTNGIDELYWYYNELKKIDINGDFQSYKMGMLGYEVFKNRKEEKHWSNYSSDADDLLEENNFSQLDINYFMLDTVIFYLAPTYFNTETIIFNLEGSVSLTDSVLLGDVYSKLAELYKDLDGREASKKNYLLALEYGSYNASVVEDLVNIQMVEEEYQSSYELLNGAYRRNELYYEDLVLLSELSMLSGEYLHGDSIIDIVRNILPNLSDNIERADALKYMLSEDYDKALLHYQAIYDRGDRGLDITYTISRLHAQLGNVEEAQKSLLDASSLGFSYYWVLKNDPMMTALKDTEIFETIIQKNDPLLK